MPALDNIDGLITLYWEADRSAVRECYEQLFGRQEEADSTSTPGSDENQADEPEEPRHRDTQPNEGDIRSDFEEVLKELALPELIANRIRDAWNGLSAAAGKYAREYALLMLDSAGRREWTIPYQMEGLLNRYDAWIATHVLHESFPSEVFAIDSDGLYERLRRILRLLGIDYADDQSLLPVEIALNISKAVEEYRIRHSLKHWQMWALVYDLGPRLLPAPGPYSTDPPPRVWLAAANKPSGDFDAVDQHTSSDLVTWAINGKARRGDFVLMYCIAPRSAIVAIYRCACDASREPFRGYWTGYRVELTDKMAIPWLPFKELKADPMLVNWHMVKVGFTGLLRHQVPDQVWQRIKELIASKDVALGRRLEQYVTSTGGVRILKESEDEWSEKEVEDKLVISLLERLGWQIGRTISRQVEMAIKVGAGRPHQVFADFVGYRDALGSDALLVVETKRRIRSETELRRAVEQCESYCGKLRCPRFGIAAPEGFWVYKLNFPGQSSQLAVVQMQGQISTSTVEELRAWIGFEALLPQS